MRIDFKRFLLAILFLVVVFPMFSQEYFGRDAWEIVPGASKVWIKDDLTYPSYIGLAEGHEVAEANVLSWIRSTYGRCSDFTLHFVNEEVDFRGDRHRRVKLAYHEVPLFDAMLVLHFNDGMMYSINGDAPSDFTVMNQMALSEEGALQAALSHVNAEHYKWQIPAEEAMLKTFYDDPDATYYPEGRLKLYRLNRNEDYRYAWVFNIYAHEPLYRADVFVDAQTGEILFEHNLIHETDVIGTAVTKYSGTQTFTTDSTGTHYRLRQSGRGNGIETFNMQRGTTYGNAVDFTDNDNYWDNFNANMDEIATDAHWGTEVTYDYFFERHNRNSLDNNGFKLRSFVHYGNNYANAFWDGQRMTYGDGNGSNIGPMAALDIVGHEVTHGLTAMTAQLVYQDEPGALNEGFSDIFGTSIEWFAKPASANWTVGEDIGIIIRSMSNPKSRGLPDTYLGTNWYTGTANNGGVHTNNGPLAHWYYILSVGKTGVNDNNDSYSVSGITIDSAGTIAYRMLTVYLTNTSEYIDARYYAIQSAIDLFGPCSPEVEATTDAMYAIGVGDPYVPGVISDFTAPQTEFCAAPALVSFSNLSNNGISYHWDFGNGQTSTDHNPTVTYTSPGDYTVTLIVDGGSCGVDTLVQTAFISIDPQHPCNYNMPQQGSLTSTECQGFLYDSGGPANYHNNTNGVFVISPPGAMSVTLNFQSFEFEEGYDYLYVYDGDNINAPLIGRYDGNTLPNGGTITSTIGSITLRQSTDQAVTESGFFLGWTCQYPTAAPIADFVVSDTLTCSGEITFMDISTNGPNDWLWDFGDGNYSNDRIVTHTYHQSGTYTVTLTTANAIGSHTITKTEVVRVRLPFPDVRDVAVCVTGDVTLANTDSSTITRWYNSESASTPFHTGSSYSLNNLTQTTTYWVDEVIEQPLHIGGKMNNAGAGSFFTAAVQHHLVFDVHKHSVLESVLVYAGSAGNRTIQLRNSNGNLLQSRVVSLTQGANTVDLNFDLAPGTGYRLVGPTSPNLYRNSGGIAFPYHIEDLVSITHGSANSNPTGYYYYFYQWRVSERPCISDRVPVTAYVNNDPPTADFTFTQTDPVVSFSDQSTNPGVSEWVFGDGNTATGSNPVHQYSAVGTYSVLLTVDNGCGIDQTIKQVTIQTMDIEEHDKEVEWLIYPNPSDGAFNIRVPEVFAGVRLLVELYDMTGRQVISSIHPGDSHTIRMQTGNTTPGIYLLHIRAGEETHRARIVIR